MNELLPYFIKHKQLCFIHIKMCYEATFKNTRYNQKFRCITISLEGKFNLYENAKNYFVGAVNFTVNGRVA